MFDYALSFVIALLEAYATLLAGYYIIIGLARANILWTIVEQGWRRVILERGQYYRTIGPGLHWLGLPGINTLYKREMVFHKSVTDQDGKALAVPHKDKDIGSFKSTDYPYAFPFKDEEDSHGLPLSGIFAVIAVLQDLQKAFFVAGDWYSIMDTEIMPCFRKTLVQVSYDDDIVGRDTKQEQKRKTIDEHLWDALTQKENNGLSIVEKLFKVYGIEVKSANLKSVDPPENWRATTLAPYKAQREAEAEKAIAAKEAEVGSRVLRIVANRCGIDLETLKKMIKKEPSLRGKSESQGGFRKAFAYAEDQTKRDRAAEKGTLADVRMGSTDGTPLPNNLQYLSVGGGGGGAGIMFGGKPGKQKGNQSKGEKDQNLEGSSGVDWDKTVKDLEDQAQK